MQIILFADRLNDRETAHEYLMEQFAFPAYYGKNLDALYDCLTEICEPTEVTVVRSEEEMSDYGKSILEVFEDASEECAELMLLIE